MSATKNEPNEEEFAVVYSQFSLRQLRQIRERAIVAGVEHELLAAMKLIEVRLRTDPRNFGEEFRRLSRLRLVRFKRVAPPIVVFYAVHDVERRVYVQCFLAAPGARL